MTSELVTADEAPRRSAPLTQPHLNHGLAAGRVDPARSWARSGSVTPNSTRHHPTSATTAGDCSASPEHSTGPDYSTWLLDTAPSATPKPPGSVNSSRRTHGRQWTPAVLARRGGLPAEQWARGLVPNLSRHLVPGPIGELDQRPGHRPRLHHGRTPAPPRSSHPPRTMTTVAANIAARQPHPTEEAVTWLVPQPVDRRAADLGLETTAGP